MSGGQDAATALYVSSMAMRALPGAGCGLELRFFLRGGWRVSILRRRVGLAVSDCLVSPCCSRRRAFEEEFASGSARTINAAPLGKLRMSEVVCAVSLRASMASVDKELLWLWPTLM